MKEKNFKGQTPQLLGSKTRANTKKTKPPLYKPELESQFKFQFLSQLMGATATVVSVYPLFTLAHAKDFNQLPAIKQTPIIESNNSNKINTTKTQGNSVLASNFLGHIVLSQEPFVTQAQLHAVAPPFVVAANGYIQEPLEFQIYSNYFAFIESAEIQIFASSATEQMQPLQTLAVAFDKNTNQTRVFWNPNQQSKKSYQKGDVLHYVLRVFDKNRHWDETIAKQIPIISSAEKAHYLAPIASSNEDHNNAPVSWPINRRVESFPTNQNHLRKPQLAVQNIVLNGSRIQIKGYNVAPNIGLQINGSPVVLDADRKFTSEYILPAGTHDFQLVGTHTNGTRIESQLQTIVKDDAWRAVGQASITTGTQFLENSIEPLSSGDLDELTKTKTQAHVAFSVKGKIKGQYILQAQLDTQEKDLQQLFKHILKPDRATALKEIQAQSYYPIDADNALISAPSNPNGALFVQLNWEKNQAKWGSFQTDFHHSSIASYNRSLYGAQVQLNSQAIHSSGQAAQQINTFAAQASTQAGYSEFLGTGGSLYYLQHTLLSPKTAQLKIELRDPLTGRLLQTRHLKEKEDYELHLAQGRVVLNSPLAPFSRLYGDAISITQKPAHQVLVATYEYYDHSLFANNNSAGAQLKQWITPQIAIGTSAVKEQKTGQDYSLLAADLTFQNGPGTWVKLEHAQSQSFLNPHFFSADGGLSYDPIQTSRLTTQNTKGNAQSLELQLDTQAQNWTQSQWLAKAWFRRKTPYFSSNSETLTGLDRQIKGLELKGSITPQLQVLSSYERSISTGKTNVEPLFNTPFSNTFKPNKTPFYYSTKPFVSQAHEINQAQLGFLWNLHHNTYLHLDLEKLTQATPHQISETNALSARVTQKISDNWSTYLGHRTQQDASLAKTQRIISVGSDYQLTDKSNAFIEVARSQSANAISIGANYQRTPEHQLYGSFSYTHHQLEAEQANINGSSFPTPGSLTVGQRLRLSPNYQLQQESQQLLSGANTGLLNSLSFNYSQDEGWFLGAGAQQGVLKNHQQESITQRSSYALSTGFINKKINWLSRLEHRRDDIEANNFNKETHPFSSSIHKQEQWNTQNRLALQFNPDIQVQGQINYAITESQNLGNSSNPAVNSTDAKLIDNSIRLVWRPTNSQLNTVFQHRYFYDVAPTRQSSENNRPIDQKSYISSVQASYTLNRDIEIGGQIAHRKSLISAGPGQSNWATQNALFSAISSRIYLSDKHTSTSTQASFDSAWSLMTEYRQLKVSNNDTKKGFLITLDKDLTSNLRFGVGYNSTDFSSDLTQFNYKSKGFFVNLVMTTGFSQ